MSIRGAQRQQSLDAFATAPGLRKCSNREPRPIIDHFINDIDPLRTRLLDHGPIAPQCARSQTEQYWRRSTREGDVVPSELSVVTPHGGVMRIQLNTSLAIACLGLAVLAAVSGAHAQHALRRIALKSGESTELRNFYAVQHCRSIL